MNVITVGLATIGSAVDRIVAAIVTTARRVHVACTAPTNRRTTAVVAGVVLIGYLLAIGDIVVSASGGSSATATVQTAPANLFRTKAAYLFEPVLAVHLGSHLAVFVSPVNILLGSIVAVLAAANVAVARHAARQAACRRGGYGRLVSVLPALGLGFACCVPTLLLLAGASVSAALLPVMLAVRPVFYPLTVILLGTTVVWAARTASPETGPRPLAAVGNDLT